MWILHIQIKPLLQVLDLYLPSDFVLLALVPPFDCGGEFVELDGFGFGVTFLSFGQAVFVIPDFFGRGAFLEEEQVGGDGGGMEGGLRKADDGVQVAVGQEFFSDAFLVTVAGDAAVGQDDGATTAGLEELDHENDE